MLVVTVDINGMSDNKTKDITKIGVYLTFILVDVTVTWVYMNLETFQSKISHIFLRKDIRVIKSGGNDQKRTNIAIYLRYRSNRYCPIRHQKEHFIELTLIALGAIMGVPNNGLLQDANATTLDPETERKVNNLDEYVSNGRAH